MKVTFGIVKNMFRIHFISYTTVHLIPISITVALSLYVFHNSLRQDFNYVDMLNSIGILTAFYLFGMEKIDLEDMMKRYTLKSKPVFSNKIYKQGTRMVYTYYSLMLTQVFLIGLQYIMFILGCESIVLLILSICYMVVSIIFAVLCWHGYLIMKG